jgi:hypothetical protein
MNPELRCRIGLRKLIGFRIYCADNTSALCWQLCSLVHGYINGSCFKQISVIYYKVDLTLESDQFFTQPALTLVYVCTLYI